MIGIVSLTERLDDEVEVLERKLDKLSYRIRVAMPGIIRSFDAETQTVSVDVAIRERLSFDGKPFENVEIPTLLQVPIAVPRAGNFVLTLPIKRGDECLLVFTDNCYDSWYESGEVSNQLDNRRHDLSDAIAIIGIGSQPNIVSDYSTDSAMLRSLDGKTYVELKDDEVNVVAPTKVLVQAEDVDVSATNVNINGSNVDIEGGTVNIDGNSTIEGRVFMNHTHLGVQTGSGSTGGVV